MLGHDDDVLAIAALELLAQIAPSFGAHLVGDRCGAPFGSMPACTLRAAGWLTPIAAGPAR